MGWSWGTPGMFHREQKHAMHFFFFKSGICSSILGFVVPVGFVGIEIWKLFASI